MSESAGDRSLRHAKRKIEGTKFYDTGEEPIKPSGGLTAEEEARLQVFLEAIAEVAKPDAPPPPKRTTRKISRFSAFYELQRELHKISAKKKREGGERQNGTIK